MLDRAFAVVEAYVHVAAVLGPRGAAAWFEASTPALDGEVPRRLLKTSYGRRLVQDLVDALLAGCYVSDPAPMGSAGESCLRRLGHGEEI